jgi:hypothetical protein
MLKYAAVQVMEEQGHPICIVISLLPRVAQMAETEVVAGTLY